MKPDIDKYFQGSAQEQQQSQDVLVNLGLIVPPTRTIQQTQVKQPKTEKGLNNANISIESGLNICPDNVINDVSRLKILIGGKRAGNNSREIINEAANICQLLFQNKIVDSQIYREIIDEFIDSD